MENKTIIKIVLIVSVSAVFAENISKLRLFNEVEYLNQSTPNVYFTSNNPRMSKRVVNQRPLSLRGHQTVEDLENALSRFRHRPVLVLLLNSKEEHSDAELFLSHLMTSSMLRNDFWLMKFNSSGVSSILAQSLIDEKLFGRLLQWSEKSVETHTSAMLGPLKSNGGVAFFSILQATRSLPFNSPILLFTDKQPEDQHLMQHAAREMNEKQIKLFVAWGGIYPGRRDEEKSLKQTAILSGGGFFVANTERKLADDFPSIYADIPIEMKQKEMVAIKKHIIGAYELSFLVDGTVNGIHVSTTGPLKNIYFITPRGGSLDLKNRSEAENFSQGSFVLENDSPNLREIYIVTSSASVKGVWQLRTRGVQNNTPYDIIVSLETSEGISTHVVDTFDVDAVKNEKTPISKKVLRVDLPTQLNPINISLLDNQGSIIKNDVPFSLSGNNQEVESLSDEETENKKDQVDIDLENLPQQPLYVKVNGKDTTGNHFERLTYFDRNNYKYRLPLITIEVGIGSELLATPNQESRILFEVTNNYEQAFFVYFSCQDQRSLLSRMEPRGAWLNPKQTLTVTVTTYANNAAGVGYTDLITFTAFGPSRVQKSATMFVNNGQIDDDEEPRMWHKYTSDCTDVILQDCNSGTWAIEVTAQDTQTGLLQLSSIPSGLYVPTLYTAGTKEPVVGYYSGSCCQSKIQVSAVDLRNNRRTYTVDAYYAPLHAGSIAAIVLGVILLVVIILAIVIACCVKCRKKESVDLPTYRGGSSQRRY